MGTWRITLAEVLCRTKHIVYQKLVPACQPYQSINRVTHPTPGACSEPATLIASAIPPVLLTLHVIPQTLRSTPFALRLVTANRQPSLAVPKCSIQLQIPLFWQNTAIFHSGDGHLDERGSKGHVNP